MEFSDRLGWVALIMAFVGLAITILWPTKRWIGWLSLSLAVVLGAVWGWLEFRAPLPTKHEIEATGGTNEVPVAPTPHVEDFEKQKRLTVRTELGRLLKRNTEIRENCQRDEPPKGFSCWTEWIHWRDQTRKYILKNMEPPYLARFKATTGTHMLYKRTPSGGFLEGEGSDAVNLLAFSAATLDQFIKEFQN
jgi:hypothetical protein